MPTHSTSICLSHSYSIYPYIHPTPYTPYTQGPPGQMTYLHVEGHDRVMISASKLVNDPNELIDFLVGSLLVQFSAPGGGDRPAGLSRISEEEEEDDDDDSNNGENNRDGLSVHISALTACKRALYIVKAAVSILERRIDILTQLQTQKHNNNTNNNTNNSYQQQSSSGTGSGSGSRGHLSTPEMSRRYEQTLL